MESEQNINLKPYGRGQKIVRVISDWVYEVQDIFQRKTEEVHAQRMTLYRASMEGKVAVDKLVKQAAQSQSTYQLASSFHSMRTGEKDLRFKSSGRDLPTKLTGLGNQ